MLGKIVHCKVDAHDVYIGRPGPWGNPFTIGRDGTREDVIAKYKVWLWDAMQRDPAMKAKVAGLHGKTLGCYCAPQACHGDVLTRAAEWAAGDSTDPDDTKEDAVQDDYDADLAAAYDRMEAAKVEAAKVRHEKELIARFDAAVDAWAASDCNAHLKPKTLSLLFDCDECGQGGRFVQGECFVSDDRAFFCPTCWAAVNAPVRAPRAPGHARCECERDSASLQVYYADRFNEALGLATTDDVGNTVPGDERRDVPEWVRLRAATVEANCPAAVHFGSVLLDEWLGNDVLTSDDERKAAQLADEDERLMLQASLTDAARPRWVSEHDSYVDQHEFIEQLTVQRRNLLIRLIRACGGDPNLPETVAWVQDAIAKKHGNRLRGYARCIYMLQRKIESGEIEVSA